MADLIRKMQEGHTVEDLDTVIDEVYEARGEYDSLDERLDDMSSGTPAPASSTPSMDGTGSAGTSNQYARADHVHPSDTSKQNALSSTQLDAVNSGIDSEKVAQIETNKNNILFNARNGVINMTNISDITLSSDGYLANRVVFNASAGTYRLKSNISGGTAKYTVVARMGNTEVYRNDTTIGTPDIDHTFTLSTAADSISIWVQIQSGTPAISNTMVYPSTLGDITYQPYALPNTVITPALQECVDNGVKNRLPATSTTTSTSNGLTLVVNSDYSITITGTMTTVEDTDIYFIGSWLNTSPFANYTGKNMRIYCKSLTSIDGQFKMYDRTARKIYVVAINNNEGSSISGDLTAAYFTIAATADAINVTLYPMICEPSSYIVSQQYIPPAMSNAELTAAILAIQAQLANQ